MTSELTHAGPLDSAEQTGEPAPVSDPAPPPPRRLGRRVAFALGLPLLVSAGIVTILVTCCQTAFEINDDTTLSAIVNGDYTGHRSSSLVVAPAMFANVMRVGYAMLPHLPWYGITLYVFQAVAWAAIGALAFTLRRRPPIAERVVVLATMVVLAPWMILRVSFTSTALLLGAAGIMVFAASAKVRGRIGTAYAVAAGLLVGTLYLIRVYSFLGVVIAFAPVLAIIAYKAGVRRTAVFALTVGIFVLVGFGTNQLQYGRSAEWRAFMKMNSARSSLHATPRVSDENVTRKDLDAIGWTHNDLKLFADFYYPDPSVYSAKSIQKLAQLSPRVREDDSASMIFHKLRGTFVAVPLAVAVLLSLRRGRRAALLALLCAGWLGGVLVALMIYVRLPNRVLIPLEGGGAFIAAIVPGYLVAARPRVRTSANWVSGVVIALVAVLLAGTFWQGVRSPVHISNDNAHQLHRRNNAYAGLLEIDPKGVFLARGDFFGLNADPLSAETPFDNPNFIPLGWATNSPLFEARIHRAGIDDVYRSLVRNPHVYLYGTGLEIRRVALFYKQHRGPVVYRKVSPHTIYGYNVWRFEPAPTTKAAASPRAAGGR